MEQPIYADVLFLINFSMDYLTLYLCARLLHLPLHAMRMAIAAAVGGVYGVASLFFSVDALRGIALHIAVACFLCYLAYRPHRFSHLCKAVLLFYGIGFLIGGTMTAIYSLWNRYLFTHRVYENGNYRPIAQEPTLPTFAALAALSVAVAALIGIVFSKRSQQKTVLLQLELEGRLWQAQALVDSGNLTQDPISGRPIVFVRYAALVGWLPPPLALFFEKPTPQALCRLPHDLARRVRYLPIQTVQGQSGVYCLRPDGAAVAQTPCAVLVAIVQRKEDFGACCALVPPMHPIIT